MARDRLAASRRVEFRAIAISVLHLRFRPHVKSEADLKSARFEARRVHGIRELLGFPLPELTVFAASTVWAKLRRREEYEAGPSRLLRN